MSTLLVILVGTVAALGTGLFLTRHNRAPAQAAGPEANGPCWHRSPPVAPIAEDIHISSQLGDYRIESLLGVGGMSHVFRAVDERNGHPVALKVPRLDDEEFLEAFEQELEISRTLNHPHLVAVHQSGFSQGKFYAAMELVEGITLEDILFHGPIGYGECLEILKQLVQVLYFAHRQGYVHGDIKPANLMLTQDGFLKMLDFGIAGQLREGKGERLMGTPDYLAPEVLRTGVRTPLSDQFAVGVVCFEMLTGRSPFHGCRPQELANLRTPALSTWRKGIPSTWEHLVQRMLSKDPARRFPDLAVVHDHLVREGEKMK